MSTTVTDNYRYWQESGSIWPSEYEQRKKLQILYHIQEIMLADYMAHSAPARVLEFGCGFGRHLQYLKQIAGLDVYGFDQSISMLAGFATWADPAWTQKHVVLGEPVGRLPYPDKFFDIVYTAEVLVHVRPEDVPSVLTELLRVAKWQLFHLETARDFPLTANAHNGCWYHDLVDVYAQLGYQCDILPQGYRAHVPYRVLLDSTRSSYAGSAALAWLFKHMEDDLQPTLELSAALQRLGSQIEPMLAAEQERTQTLTGQVQQLEAALAAEQAQAANTQQTLEQRISVLQSTLQSRLTQYASFVEQAQTMLRQAER